MGTELSIEDLFIERCEILDQRLLETAFIKSKQNLEQVRTSLQESVVDISNKLLILTEHLNQLKENNNSCRKLLLSCQELDKKILHMYENVPEKLTRAYVNIIKDELVESNSSTVFHHNISSRIQSISKGQHQNDDFNDELNVQELTITDCKKNLFSKPELPEISLLREEEYDKIPKYMIGRQTLDKVNSLVISINKVLKTKYSLLFAGKEAAKKKGYLETYLQYKKQDIIRENTGCKYFFTVEDYESSTKAKLDRTALNMMMALRHCKRIREYRSKKELYYIVLN